MRRLLSIALGFAISVAWSSVTVHASSTGCGQQCDLEDDSSTYNGEELTVPARGKAYCDDPNRPVFNSVGLDRFLTKTDETIKSRRSDGNDPRTWPAEPIVVPDIAIAQQFLLWCSTPEVQSDSAKVAYFWVPLATADSVSLNASLLAKVQGRLKMPDVVWLDLDRDHGWLWVRIEHHVGISAPVPVSETASDGNAFTGYVSAWVKATPVSFSIELPPETGVSGLQLAACDLTQATSDEGCKIKFEHASSIGDAGWFVGYAQVEWEVSSNSGKYNGVGPFITSTEIRIQVAESMAVGQSAG